ELSGPTTGLPIASRWRAEQSRLRALLQVVASETPGRRRGFRRARRGSSAATPRGAATPTMRSLDWFFPQKTFVLREHASVGVDHRDAPRHRISLLAARPVGTGETEFIDAFTRGQRRLKGERFRIRHVRANYVQLEARPRPCR